MITSDQLREWIDDLENLDEVTAVPEDDVRDGDEFGAIDANDLREILKGMHAALLDSEREDAR